MVEILVAGVTVLGTVLVGVIGYFQRRMELKIDGLDKQINHRDDSKPVVSEQIDKIADVCDDLKIGQVRLEEKLDGHGRRLELLEEN